MIRLAIVAGVLLLAAANAHLVYVAMESQPECVAHIRRGDTGAGSGGYAAATSACSP